MLSFFFASCFFFAALFELSLSLSLIDWCHCCFIFCLIIAACRHVLSELYLRWRLFYFDALLLIADVFMLMRHWCCCCFDTLITAIISSLLLRLPARCWYFLRYWYCRFHADWFSDIFDYHYAMLIISFAIIFLAFIFLHFLDYFFFLLRLLSLYFIAAMISRCHYFRRFVFHYYIIIIIFIIYLFRLLLLLAIHYWWAIFTLFIITPLLLMIAAIYYIDAAFLYYFSSLLIAAIISELIYIDAISAIAITPLFSSDYAAADAITLFDIDLLYIIALLMLMPLFHFLLRRYILFRHFFDADAECRLFAFAFLRHYFRFILPWCRCCHYFRRYLFSSRHYFRRWLRRRWYISDIAFFYLRFHMLSDDAIIDAIIYIAMLLMIFYYAFSLFHLPFHYHLSPILRHLIYAIFEPIIYHFWDYFHLMRCAQLRQFHAMLCDWCTRRRRAYVIIIISHLLYWYCFHCYHYYYDYRLLFLFHITIISLDYASPLSPAIIYAIATPFHWYAIILMPIIAAFIDAVIFHFFHCFADAIISFMPFHYFSDYFIFAISFRAMIMMMLAFADGHFSSFRHDASLLCCRWLCYAFRFTPLLIFHFAFADWCRHFSFAITPPFFMPPLFAIDAIALLRGRRAPSPLWCRYAAISFLHYCIIYWLLLRFIFFLRRLRHYAISHFSSSLPFSDFHFLRLRHFFISSFWYFYWLLFYWLFSRQLFRFLPLAMLYWYLFLTFSIIFAFDYFAAFIAATPYHFSDADTLSFYALFLLAFLWWLCHFLPMIIATCFRLLLIFSLIRFADYWLFHFHAIDFRFISFLDCCFLSPIRFIIMLLPDFLPLALPLIRAIRHDADIDFWCHLRRFRWLITP